MKINQPRRSGTLESGDVVVHIAPLEYAVSTCKSIAAFENRLAIKSHHHCWTFSPRYNVRGVQLNVDDKGALDCVACTTGSLLARASGIRLCHGRIANDFRFAATT
ncbi:citrate lyase ACP [Escherichia coli]